MQRQLAMKVCIIFGLGLLMLIPINMVQFKVYERQGYLEEAKTAVSKSWTGRQLVVSPILVVPYRLAAIETPAVDLKGADPLLYTSAENKISVVLPDQLTNIINVDNTLLFKGIYEIPVYDSQLEFKGSFSARKLTEALREIRSTEGFESLGEPYISIHISDARGISDPPTLLFNHAATTINPGSKLSALPSGVHAFVDGLAALKEVSEKESIEFSLQLSLRGMESLNFLALSDVAGTRLSSNWPHPQFIGASLPKERDISSDGFSAYWSSSRYSMSGADLLMGCLSSKKCRRLKNNASGVSFIDPVDVYLQSERSIKYAVLFIGLSFITFFVFEQMTRKRIHPIQYAFVGLAISVFYLLLISLAEHISFGWSYLIAVVCCASLLLFYVRYMLRSLLSAGLFCTMLVGLYGLLYVIVQAEDFALLMGSVLVFLVLTVLMTVTRGIDWYSLSVQDDTFMQKELDI